MRFELVTVTSPDQVREALTDFSPRRLEIWSRTLDPATYDVREQGHTWAVAVDSTPGSPYWVVARYDWSDPAVMRFETVESSYGGGGTGSVRVAPTADGGSRVAIEWSYSDVPSRKDKVVLALADAQHHPPRVEEGARPVRRSGVMSSRGRTRHTSDTTRLEADR